MLHKLGPTGVLYPVTPLGNGLPFLSKSPGVSTKLMGILNSTPDSFSNDGLLPSSSSDLGSSLFRLRPLLESFVSSEVAIVDVGGQSTRPNASTISADEEIERILPTIRYIQSQSNFKSLTISIDTFNGSVARAALGEGANIINDVSGGLHDPQMLPIAAEMRASIVLMHMRGTSRTMGKLTSYPEGVVPTVGKELLSRVKAAEKVGIPRWRIILDPGLGFAKTPSQSIELLRDFSQLRDHPGLEGFPWVVGPSRKGFVGKVTKVHKAEDRLLGTAVCVAECARQGVDLVRVHDVVAMTEALRMSDALKRGMSAAEE